MRRPSRLGLLSVCSYRTSRLLTAPSLFQRREISLCSAPPSLFINHFFRDAHPRITSQSRCDVSAAGGLPDPRIALLERRFVTRTSQVLFLLFLIAHFAHTQDVTKDLRQYFDGVRSENPSAVPPAIFGTSNAEEALETLRLFAGDSISNVRRKALELMALVTVASEDNLLRSRGVEMILTCVSDHDKTLMGISLDLLKHFQIDDFTDQSKGMIARHIINAEPWLADWIKIGGFLKLEHLKSNIRPLTLPGNRPGLRWSAIVSLARMGDPKAVSDMMSRVRRLPVNDDLVYQVFPDLIFTRQREAISFIVATLQADDMNCLSADAERQFPIPCGYRIMELLAPVIAGFPFTVGDGGDLQTDDYRAALETIRRWFEANKNYQILNDTY